jgi:hypothetical protein
MADGFLGRWSRRKLGQDAPEPTAAPVMQPLPPEQQAGGQGTEEEAPAAVAAQPVVPPPTLEDVQALTPESDFRRFTAADVSPDVRNAAMKKLFSDPHFNVMDGMDVYVGDYSQSDPIPAAMLRKLAGAKFLGLFDDEEDKAAPVSREVADNPNEQTVAKLHETPPAVPDADPDLRLQQDDAPPGRPPGGGTA